MHASIIRDMMVCILNHLAPYLACLARIGLWGALLLIALIAAWSLIVAVVASSFGIVVARRRHVTIGG